VWACPVCSAKIVERRAVLLQQVLDRWHGEGYRVGFVTLTVRHTAKTSLQDVWGLVMKSWAKCGSASSWRTDQENWGVMLPGNLGKIKKRIPIVRTVEGSRGENGWHIHLHLLVFFDGGSAPADRWGEISDRLTDRWDVSVRAAGGSLSRKAQSAELVDPSAASSERVGSYLAKSVFSGSGESAIHWEMAGGVGKRSSAGRTPWQLLADSTAGDERAAALWTAWELGSRGHRQMYIPVALVDRYGLRDETDEEAVAAADERAADWSPADNVSLCQKPGQDHFKRIGPPELVCDAPVRFWHEIDLTRRIGAFVLDWGPDPGGVTHGLEAMGIPVAHGWEPRWDCVVVAWREWRSARVNPAAF
jgi:hypothetical protein